jgi:hypothetical protein
MFDPRNATVIGILMALLSGISCAKDNTVNLRGRHGQAADGADQGAAAGEAAAAAAAAATADEALARLVILSPGELGTKIYQVFGANMTTFNDGKKDANYLDVNSNSFTGTISSDPNNKIASSATTGYFLAVAGLSAVVGDDYSAAFYAKTAKLDCTVDADALQIAKMIAISADQDELNGIATDLKAACKVKPRDAVKAMVQSLSFIVKATR